VSVTGAVNNSTQFKIVLPFLFTTPVSGDGLNDIHLSVPNVGINYALLGRSSFSSREVLVSSLPVSSGPVSLDYTARSVAIAGDVNGDGYDDLIIGVPYASRCYVMFGTVNGFVNITEGFAILGVESSDLLGWSVSGAGKDFFLLKAFLVF
jgi:hypothetical protein